MAGSDDVQCKRSSQCKCPECAEANAAFSISDLPTFKSSINYGDDAANSLGSTGPNNDVPVGAGAKRHLQSQTPPASQQQQDENSPDAAAGPRPPTLAPSSSATSTAATGSAPAAVKPAAVKPWQRTRAVKRAAADDDDKPVLPQDDDERPARQNGSEDVPTGDAAAVAEGVDGEGEVQEGAVREDDDQHQQQKQEEEEDDATHEQEAISRSASPAPIVEPPKPDVTAASASVQPDAPAADPSIPMQGVAVGAAGGGDAGDTGSVATMDDGSISSEADIVAAEVDQSTLRNRIVDKAWKTRRRAFMELLAVLNATDSPDDPAFATYRPLLVKMVEDGNASALDCALDAVMVFAEKGPCGADVASKLAPVVVSKTFAARPATAKKGQALLLKFIEVDDPRATVDALLEGTSDKRVKVPPMCVNLIVEALRAFGPFEMPFEAFNARLVSWFESSNGNLRASVMELLKESKKWGLASVFDDTIEKLRSSQKTEIRSALEVIAEGNATPTVGLRKYRDSSAPADAGPPRIDVSAVKASVQAAAKTNMYEMVAPVDLEAKLREAKFYEKVEAPTKWSQKLEAIQMLINTLGDIPKVAPGGDYNELIKILLKDLVTHSHQHVSNNAIRALGVLGSGLRERMSHHGHSIFTALVAKSKDKKSVKDVSEALEKLYGRVISFESVIEDIEASLDPKKTTVPHCRQLVVEFVDKGLEVVPHDAKTEFSTEIRTRLGNALKQTLEDSDPKVREKAVSAAAALIISSRQTCTVKDSNAIIKVFEEVKVKSPKVYLRLMGDPDGGVSPSNASLASTGSRPESSAASISSSRSGASRPPSGHPAKLPSMDNSVSSAASSSSAGGAGRSGAAAGGGVGRPAHARSVSNSALKRNGSKPDLGRSAGAAKASTSQRPASSSSSGGAGGHDDDDAPLPDLDPDQAAAKLAEVLQMDKWDEEVVSALKSAKWQDRRDALGRIRRGLLLKTTGSDSTEQRAETVTPLPDGTLAALVCLLSEHTKKWKESNFNVVKEALDVATAGIRGLPERVSGEDKAVIVALVNVAVEKVSDRKLGDSAMQLLTDAAEVLGPMRVVKRVIKIAAAAKAPPQHTEAMNWLKSCISDFGTVKAGVEAITSFAVSEAASSNAAIRKAAIELLGALYSRVGPSLKSLAIKADTKPALQQAIEAEFNNVGYDANTAAGNAPTRKVRGEAEDASAQAGGGGGGIARFDLGSLEKDLLTKMAAIKSKESWKTRKECIETITAACERSGHRVEANKACAEVLKGLKARLVDSQSNLKPMAATAIGEVLVSLDETVAPKYARLIAEALLAGVADNKKVMRDASLAALERILTLGGHSEGHSGVMELLLAPLGTAMMHANGRTELLNCLAKYLPVVHCDANMLVGPLLDALQDKVASARTAAEACLIPLVRNKAVRGGAIENGMRDFAPAVKRSLAHPLQRVQQAAVASAPSPPPTHTPAPLPPPSTHPCLTTAGSPETKRPPQPSPSDSSVSSTSSFFKPGQSATTSAAAAAAAGGGGGGGGSAAPAPPLIQQSTTRRASAVGPNPPATSAATTNHHHAAAPPPIPVPHDPTSSPSRSTGADAVVTTAAARRSSPTRSSSREPADLAASGGAVDLYASSGGGALRRHDGKRRREDESRRIKWPVPPEEPRADDADALKAAWTPWLSQGEGGSYEKLFPSQGRKGALDTSIYLGGAELLLSAVDDSVPTLIEHLDLIFKWITLRLCEKENVQVLQRLLELLVRIVEALRDHGYNLMDFEAAILVPHVLEKSGQAKDRFRKQFRTVMRLLCDIFPFSKYGPMVVCATLATKNSRTRTACLDELRRLVEISGYQALGKKGIKEIARFVDAREADVRSAALDVVLAIFEKVDRSVPKLLKAVEGGVSDKGKSLVEDKCRDRLSKPASGRASSASQDTGAQPMPRSSSSSELQAATGGGGGGGGGGGSLYGSGGAGGRHVGMVGVQGRNGVGAGRNGPGMGFGDDDGDRVDSFADLRFGPIGASPYRSTTPSRAPQHSSINSTHPQRGIPATSNARTQRAGNAPLASSSSSSAFMQQQQPPRDGPFRLDDDDFLFASPPLSPTARARQDGSDGGDVESIGRWMDAMAGYIGLPDDLPVRKTQVEWTRAHQALATIAGAQKPNETWDQEALRKCGNDMISAAVACLHKAFKCGEPTPLQGIDSRMAKAGSSALRTLFVPATVCLQVTSHVLTKTLKEGVWLQFDPRLKQALDAADHTAHTSASDDSPALKAAELVDNLKRLGTEVLLCLPRHVTLAGLLDLMTTHCGSGSDPSAPEASWMVRVFKKVVKNELETPPPFNTLDLAKLVGPLDGFFRAAEGSNIQRPTDMIHAAQEFFEALVEHRGLGDVRSYITVSNWGVEPHGPLYHKFAELEGKAGGDSQKLLTEVMELATNALKGADSDVIARLHSVLRAHYLSNDHLKAYNLSTTGTAHLISRLNAYESARGASPSTSTSPPPPHTLMQPTPLSPSSTITNPDTLGTSLSGGITGMSASGIGGVGVGDSNGGSMIATGATAPVGGAGATTLRPSTPTRTSRLGAAGSGLPRTNGAPPLNPALLEKLQRLRAMVSDSSKNNFSNPLSSGTGPVVVPHPAPPQPLTATAALASATGSQSGVVGQLARLRGESAVLANVQERLAGVSPPLPGDGPAAAADVALYATTGATALTSATTSTLNSAFDVLPPPPPSSSSSLSSQSLLNNTTTFNDSSAHVGSDGAPMLPSSAAAVSSSQAPSTPGGGSTRQDELRMRFKRVMSSSSK